MQEIWKDISGYEGLYQVSSLGRVRSLDRINTCFKSKYIRKGRILIPQIDRDGYLHLHLSKEGHSHRFSVHKLVALAFIPNPNNYEQINHKNEIKDDNRVLNLEWCNCKYNINYGNSLRIRANSQIGSHGAKGVTAYDLNGSIVGTYPSINQAHLMLGVSAWHIEECCTGKLNSCCHYKFEFT